MSLRSFTEERRDQTRRGNGSSRGTSCAPVSGAVRPRTGGTATTLRGRGVRGHRRGERRRLGRSQDVPRRRRLGHPPVVTSELRSSPALHLRYECPSFVPPIIFPSSRGWGRQESGDGPTSVKEDCPRVGLHGVSTDVPSAGRHPKNDGRSLSGPTLRGPSAPSPPLPVYRGRTRVDSQWRSRNPEDPGREILLITLVTITDCRWLLKDSRTGTTQDDYGIGAARPPFDSESSGNGSY